MINSEAEILFDYFERFLGPMKSSWRGKDGQEMPFQVLAYPKQPELDCLTLITFGLSAHQLQVSDNCEGKVRMELLICANSSFESKLLYPLLFAAGLDALEHHATPGVHGVLNGSGPVLIGGNPLFEHLYLTHPGFFPKEFDLCEELSPPVSIAQIIPISSNEREFIVREGWSEFENRATEQSVDFLEFDARKEVQLA